MGEILNVRLTKNQRDLLIRGLRYIRSYAMLQPREPNPEVDEDRASQLRDISLLVEQLNEAESTRETAKT